MVLPSTYLLFYCVIFASWSSFISCQEDVTVYRREVTVDKCSSGVTGPPGPPGPPGGKGDDGPSSEAIPNWKTCQWWMTNNGGDNEQVWTCSFTKQYSDTYLFVQMSANLRTYNGGGTACCRWHFRFNNAECSNPAAIDAVVYANGYANVNLHRPRVMMGYCKGLSAGSYSIGFWVSNCSGYGHYDCYTGWHSSSHMIIEEVTPSPYD